MSGGEWKTGASKLIVFYRIPHPCPRRKEEGEEAEVVVEGSVCFGQAGSTKGTLIALSTIVSLFG